MKGTGDREQVTVNRGRDRKKDRGQVTGIGDMETGQGTGHRGQRT